jgi:hypothetical protein
MKAVQLIVLFIAVLFFTSCSKTESLDADASERPPLSARISFVNARPVDQKLIFWTYTTQVTPTALSMNTASPYLDAQFGLVQVNTTASGSTSYLASRVFGGAATFSSSGGPNGPIPGYYHTVFALKGKGGNFSSDSLMLFYDDLAAPPAGKAKLRFVNLAAGAGPVNVLLDGEPLFSNVDYGAAGGAVLSGSGLSAYSIAPFINVDAGAAELLVQKMATSENLVSKTGGPVSITLQEGKVYTVFVNGEPNTPMGTTLLLHN